MNTVLIIQDLFYHNDWANADLLARCHQFTDQQLDQPREMGFGTLRNTLFHILEAEKLWLERWQGKPWRALVPDSGGMPLADIAGESERIAAIRNGVIEAESATNFDRLVEFYNSQRFRSSFPIGDLMMHVANHGVHHRAQILNFLRDFNQKTPRGVDYILWKLARPSCELPAESIEKFRQAGLEINSSPGKIPQFDKSRITQYFRYNDWAMHRVMDAASKIVDAGLNHEFTMGLGSLRKSIQHLIDHGTHHRAQTLNMLRQLGVNPPAIDLIVWLRDAEC